MVLRGGWSPFAAEGLWVAPRSEGPDVRPVPYSVSGFALRFGARPPDALGRNLVALCYESMTATCTLR